MNEHDETWPGSLSLLDTLDDTGQRNPPPPVLSPFPDRIGPYVCEELVGRGGMAAVYRCRDPGGEQVAVKWLHRPRPSMERRFEREIRSLARLQHCGVVHYLHQGVHDGRPYLVMEYLDGDDLRLYSRRLRNRPPSERYERVTALAVGLAEALAYIHDQGLVHRDVKPSNIRVLEGDLPVLTDFGIVKDLADDGHTAAGVVLGTLDYASPEQLMGRPVDARSDLYGLGCTLYTVLAQRRPFEGMERAEVIRAHLERVPEPLSAFDPTIPPELERVVARLMAKSPQERFPHARAVVAAFRADRASPRVALAGREQTRRQIVALLERAAGGESTLVRVEGPPGTGLAWVSRTLVEGARRRGLAVARADDPRILRRQLPRLEQGELRLLVTTVPAHVQALPNPHRVLSLEPLGPADVRRSLVGVVRDIEDPSGLAERLFRASGGLPALLVPMLRQLRANPRAFQGRPVAIDDGGDARSGAETWLEGLDMDALEVLQVLAIAEGPLTPPVVEQVVQVPAEDALGELVHRGLVREITGGESAPGFSRSFANRRYTVSAGLLADAARMRIPDPPSLARRLQDVLAQSSPSSAPLPVPSPAETGHDGVQVRLEEARGAVERGDLEAGEDALEVIRSLPEPGASARGDLRYLQAIIHQARGEPEAALAGFHAAVGCYSEAGSLEHEVLAWLACSQVLDLMGRLARALEAAERGVDIARALAAPALECVALRALGTVLLDIGCSEEASRVLADVSALAHAGDLHEERCLSHALRAAASMDREPGARAGAASAMERLLRLTRQDDLAGRTAEPLVLGLMARAAAILGDSRSYDRSLEGMSAWFREGAQTRAFRAVEPVGRREPGGGVPVGDELLPLPAVPFDIRTRLQVVRACWVAGDVRRARTVVRDAEKSARAHGYPFLAWEAVRLLAHMEGRMPPVATPFAEGLTVAQRNALDARPAFP